MNHRYAHILSPIKVGNLVLKNRLINSKCIPEGIQGPQTWAHGTDHQLAAVPGEEWRGHCYLCPGYVPGLRPPSDVHQ